MNASPLVVIEVERRRDGRRYPPGGTLPERERWRAINLAHRCRCRDGLSFRATQAALAQAGIRRSLGQLAKDVANYACDYCDPPEPVAAQQQPGSAAAAAVSPGGGWAGPAPAW